MTQKNRIKLSNETLTIERYVCETEFIEKINSLIDEFQNKENIRLSIGY
jgi:hypothetical protein